MAKIEKKMIDGVGVFVFILCTVLFVVLLATIVRKMHKSYKVTTTEVHKQKCLTKFKTIEYEVVSDVLYCKTVDGLVKFN